eukprot:GHVU01147688.1.p2 GENE.GHVU01147688.1~~GHVU01147688.1.p2  ORF type:complete len:165 (+),score=7.52 GHVU01147688.1:257-751(+)
MPPEAGNYSPNNRCELRDEMGPTFALPGGAAAFAAPQRLRVAQLDSVLLMPLQPGGPQSAAVPVGLTGKSARIVRTSSCVSPDRSRLRGRDGSDKGQRRSRFQFDFQISFCRAFSLSASDTGCARAWNPTTARPCDRAWPPARTASDTTETKRAWFCRIIFAAA